MSVGFIALVKILLKFTSMSRYK